MCFATARFIGAPVGSYAEFRDWIVEHRESVVRVILARSTQTNETARCAVLLAVLEQLDGPLSLIDRVQVDAPRHATSGRRVGTLVSSIMQGGSTGHEPGRGVEGEARRRVVRNLAMLQRWG